MSSESDYKSSRPTLALDTTSIQLPFALLSAAIAIIFVQQTVTSFKMKSTLNEGKTQLTDLVAKRQPALTEAEGIEKRFSAIVEDLMILSKTDDDAKAIVGKYGIQMGPGAGTPAPAKP